MGWTVSVFSAIVPRAQLDWIVMQPLLLLPYFEHGVRKNHLIQTSPLRRGHMVNCWAQVRFLDELAELYRLITSHVNPRMSSNRFTAHCCL